MSLSQFATLKLAPGKVDSVNATGSNFWVVFASVPIQVMYPGGEFGVYEQGSGLDNLPNGETFKRLTVKNPSLGTITVTLYIGGPLYRDSRLTVMETRTRLAARVTQSLAATGGAGDHVDLDGITAVDGGPPAGTIDIKRQSLLLTNDDLVNWFVVLDAAGTVAARVLAGKQIILPVSESVTVANTNGTPIACQIAEIWCVSIPPPP